MSRWTTFLIFQLFVALLVMQPTAWAGLASLSVDANGDSVFNGDNEKLTITFEFETDSDENGNPITYTYEIFADDQKISTDPQQGSPQQGSTLSRNQTIQVIWDGKIEGGNEKLPDGDYTIKVEIKGGENPNITGARQLTAQATLDTKDPEISITLVDNEFSPLLNLLPTYYSIDEDVAETLLEFQRISGDTSIGSPIALSQESGRHTYYWNGKDGDLRPFSDGQYTLKLRVKDKGGNEVVTPKTESITIDTEAPRFTDISLNEGIPFVDGMFVNTSIQTISFTADAGGGTPIDLTGDETNIQIKHDADYINGTLSYGNKATLTLNNSLDESTENGNYEVTVSIADRVGNIAKRKLTFTFDNVAPIFKSVATNIGEFTPGSGIRGQMDFVQATLEDNIELNLEDSTIRLTGPGGGPILGRQTRPANNIIRWELLSPLLAKDGFQDGQYTVEIVGSDKAGNNTSPIQISFLYDNLAPALVSLSPMRDGEPFSILGDTVYYNLPLNQFVATLNDGELGVGVAFSDELEATSIVFGTRNPDGSINAESGRVFPDRNNGVLTYILDTPLLKSDGSQDGNYILIVKAADSLGNTETYTYQIVYDTQLPTLNTTVPAANQTVSNLSEVVIKLNETTSGIDFGQSTFRLIRGVGENQVEISVNISNNGTDTAMLALLQPIALDGSDDGTYTIEVTPTDLAGNTGAVVRRQFYLVSQTQTQLRLTTPETGTVSSLGDVTVEIANYIGSGINFDASTITVSNAQGLIVPQAKVEPDEVNNQLTWSTEAAVPRNGSADGQYTVTATFVDFSGQRFSQQFPLYLDTQFPTINTVEVGTDPQLQLSLISATNVPETFSEINIVFSETDIDFENTVVSLMGPNGTNIALNRSNDGDAVLTLNFANLAQTGTYTFSVTPIDRIGNGSENPFLYRFHLDIAVPVVTTVSIGGKSGAVVYVDGSDGEIIATLADSTGIGLALGEGESSIVVTSAVGLPVPGTTTANNQNQLIWRPIALPTDGSADGSYTVAVTPVNKAGRIGNVAYRAFIYDTQKPRITAATPITLHQPTSYLGSLTQFQFTVEDVGPALLDLEVQTIALAKKEGDTVLGQITHDSVNQLFFTLSTPLPTDGSADGAYILTVDLVDKAGNAYQTAHDIFYDSQAPSLSSVSLNTETPLALTPYQITDISESINQLTLNFVEATQVDFANTIVTLIGPNGAAIPLTLENNGVDQITASFVSLIQSGLYTLSVTPQDRAGNTAQGAVSYPFRVRFEVPGLSAVKANTAAASVKLIQHEILEISEPVSSFTLEFTDTMRIDFENTSIVLVGPNGQEISVTQEDDTSQLIVRFVSLTQSGLYTLSVTPQDRSGNVAQSAILYQFRLAIALPAVSSILIDGKPSSTVYVNSSDVNIVATFTEPTGVGLALGDDGSSIIVTDAAGLPVQGVTKSDGTNQLTWSATALPTDGSADGVYTATITPIDKSGRAGTVVNRQFIYDTQKPRITAATPITLHQPTSYLGSLTQFQFTVEDVGPALLDLEVQTIALAKKDGDAVLGQITHDSVNQLFFTLSTPLPTDGSADGAYILTVDLIDKAGNAYQTAHDIFYDSQVPSLSSVSLNTETPLALTPYQITDISESINQLTLNFVEATQVDFANTIVTLIGPNGAAIPLTLENNGVDQITASFVSLIQSGLYTLSVTPQDRAGNTAQGAVSYPFRVRFEVPGLSAVKANTAAASVKLIQHEILEISEPVGSFTLEFTDAMRIDFENTSIVLVGPNGQEISVTQEDDTSQLIVRFVSLTQSGLYTLSVTPQDRSGNVAQSAILYQFRLAIALPAVSSILIDGKPSSTVYVNSSDVNIVATFTEPTGVGLALGDDGSSIIVTDAAGLPVQGVTKSDGTNQLTWSATALPTDGSADGVYTATITPIDKSGRAGTVVNRQFIYDTQVPRITAATPITLHQPTSYLGSLTQFQFTVEDVGPALLDLEVQTIALAKKDGDAVLGQITHDSVNQLFFTLSTPLPTDGSADGAYILTVDLIDKAGNAYQTAHDIFYDSQVPSLSSVSLNTETPLALTPYQITDISESINQLTLNFVEATQVDFANTIVTLIGPNGAAIPLTLENNGVDQITASFVSLIQSGLYTLSVTPQDRAGNTAQGAVSYPFRVRFEVPGLSAVKANTAAASVKLIQHEILEISEPVGSFTLEFTDAMRIDFENTSIVLVGPNGQEISVTQEDDTSQLIVRFVSLTQSGLYTLSVTPQDRSGNVAQSAILYQFRLAIALPAVSSILIDGKPSSTVYVNSSDVNIVATFTEPTGVGLALGDDGSSIIVTDAAGLPVQGVTKSDGTNQLTWSATALPTDGSADGVYTATITPIDKSGRAGTVVNRQFIYDTQVPRITAATPITLHQPTSYLGSLTQFQFTVEDVGPALLDLEVQTIALAKKDGDTVLGQITHDSVNQLFFTLSTPLPTDGSADGAYILTVDLIDKAGNAYQTAHDIFYDSQAPSLSSVSLNTETPLALTPYQITDISESINQLTLNFVEATQVDFANTIVTLIGPNGAAIPLTLENNGVDQITASFVSLTQSGLYTLAVTPQDRSGNVAQSAIRYQFRLAIALPAVSSILIDGKPSSTVYVNSSDVNIVATFTEPTGVGLALGDDGSSIIVTDAAGLPVQGVTKSDGTNQLTWSATALPTDGSADGVYTATITPIDKSGRAGTVVNRQFIYDTQKPRITAATPITLHQPTSYLGGLTQFQFTVEDVGPALLDLEVQTIALAKKDGDAVLGQITHDGVNQLFFTLSTPLPTDGSADGVYILTVDLIDKAGNAYQTAHDIFYDSQAPSLSSVSLNTETPLALTPYQITDISESINQLTLNFVEATQVDFANTIVTLIGPNGAAIPLTLENNGVDQITASFVSLIQSGLYTLSVTPQDRAGNTAQGAVPYPFRLLFEVPGLSSVKANTTNTSVELTPYEIMEISESVSSLTFEFIDAAQVDFVNTSVTLTGPDGQQIPVTLEDDESQLMVRFVPITQSGVYTLAVTPQDKAGNVAQSATQYQFRLDTALPTVSSVLIDGKSGSVVYVRNAVLRIVTTITDPIGVGVSLRDGGSTITVANPEGLPVSGTTSSNGTNQLIWMSIPLPTDGTADGRYTVAITPVDKSGRSGTVINREFIYDTQAPRITAASPMTLHAPISYIRSGVDEFVLIIEDVGPAGFDLASQVAALMDAAEKPVSATLTRDELSNQLYLTLSKPFANDGSVDGAYSLNVRLIDKAGNTSISQFSLVYDSKAPQIASVQVNTAGTPIKLVSNEITELTESISTIAIEFAEATRIDFENTQVSLLDPNDQTIPLTREDDGISQMTLSFAELTQSGQYTLSVDPQDIAGNATQSSIQFAFNLEFILPGVESVIIGNTVTLGSGDIAYVNANNLQIAANLLDPAGTGLSFDATTGSALQVATLDDVIVPGRIATNGTDVIVWEPVTLSNDGSSDGRYAVYVTPVDKKGREGNTIYREFVFDTQEPEITEAEPINLSQPVSYISESLTQFRFALQDVGPADLTLDDQKVSLRSQTGSLIPTKLTNDTNNQLYLTLDEPLPLNGSRDGEYTVVIAFSDKAGNVLSVEHPIVYDTQAPTLVSTVPADNAQLTEDITQIQVNLNDTGGSGIDWDVTTVTLVDPNGTEIFGELTSNGKTQLILNTNQLVADGRYTIRVQAIDRAGNGSQSVFETDFLLSRLLPAIISTSPSTAPKDEAYSNEKIEEIAVMLETADVNHLSTLRLLNSENQVIAGQQHRESDRLIYSLVRPLATDGSEDGVYTIEFTPISASGRSGEVQRLTFTYDTQVPEVEPEAISLIVTEPEVNNSLIEIRVTLTDNQAGIDWENLDKEWLAFERLSPNPNEIAGRLSYETGEQDTLIFRLTVPLADDGSADGEYQITITPKDQAGNGDETYEEVFVYDTSPPVIDPNSLLINDAPLLSDIDAEDYPSAVSTTGGIVIQASVSDTGLGVDLSRSQIVVRNPNGQEISGTTQQNGVDTISFRSDGLNVEGVYQVTIIGIGNDSELLGFAPKGSITTEFLYETTAPTAVLTNNGGKTEFTDEAVPFEGTATDPRGSRPRPQGEGEIPIPASGIWLVEIIGTGPDGQPIEPIPAEDESNAQEQPWSRWSADFLPARSGEYDLDLRVTDKAGNYAVYDAGKVTMSVSFSFRGKTFGWPNPLRHSKDDVAFFSFDLNTSTDETVELTLHIYDWGGDMVYSKKYNGITLGQRNDTQIKWNLENQAGTPVARGLYVFRLEAVNGAGNRVNAVGKVLVVD